MRIVSPGHALFAATLIAIGILCLVRGEVTAVWYPVPDALLASKALAYLCCFISLACGIGLLWPRAAAIAARVLLAYLLLWLLLFRLPDVIRAPLVDGSYEGGAETVVFVATAWVLYAWLGGDWDRWRLGFAVGEKGLRIARVMYALAMIQFGLAHFVYLELTAPLVPGWLHWPVAWSYFTGGAYIAAGAAMLVGVCAPLAAALSAAQMGLLTLLVWVPIISAPAPKTDFQWNEIFISFALTIAGWVMTDSYRGRRWLAVGKR